MKESASWQFFVRRFVHHRFQRRRHAILHAVHQWMRLSFEGMTYQPETLKARSNKCVAHPSLLPICLLTLQMVLSAIWQVFNFGLIIDLKNDIGHVYVRMYLSNFEIQQQS